MLDIMMNGVTRKTLNSLQSNNDYVGKVQNRVSSGRRLNEAADDASGVSITTRQQAIIQANEKVLQNLDTAISMIQTADGAYTSVVAQLQRMRELALQASNGTNNTGDSEDLNAEYQQMIAGIDGIVENTRFNGMQLLGPRAADGGVWKNTLMFHVSSEDDDTQTVNLQDTRTTTLGVATTDILNVADANNALASIDAALNTVTNHRQYLGSKKSSMQYAIEHINTYQLEIQQANSRIKDADIALEMSNLVKGRMLTQMNLTAMLQTNLSRQTFLEMFMDYQ